MAFKLYKWDQNLHNPNSVGYRGLCSTCYSKATWTIILSVGYQRIWARCDKCLIRGLDAGRNPKVVS